MTTSDECNKAWGQGYTDGWRQYKSTLPSIPARPASIPAGVDPLEYFYEEGYASGKEAALKIQAGM